MTDNVTHPRGDNAAHIEPVDPDDRFSAENIWRFIVVGLLAILGLTVGYQIGIALVDSVMGIDPDSASPFIRNLYLVLQTPRNALADEMALSVIGGLIGFLVGSSAFNRIAGIVENVQGMRSNEKIALFLGVLSGLLLTVLMTPLLLGIPKIGWLLTAFMGVLFVYFCTAGTLSMKESFRFSGRAEDGGYQPNVGEPTSSQVKILDTNVIIDGRVSDVCRTGFIEGTIYVPGFVLDELQHIADSSDSLKRARGRRGLDILNSMRSELPLQVRTLDIKAEYPPNEEVDSKLVRLAKKIGGAIVTNDFNLNKVAELQGVPVLNINELANALKPVVLPGEEMHVAVIKEGKEMNQGIGYLDDGTMIVIEGARRRIGDTLEVVVSSVLQTVAGKMIFATIKTHDEGYDSENGEGSESGSRSYSSGRPRRPFRDR